MTDSGGDGVLEAGDVDVGERAEPGTPGPGAAGPGRPQAEVRRRRVSWRAPVAAVLIVLGCVLAPASVVAVWTANQVSDTSRYVANMAPLIGDPAIQNALTSKIADAVAGRLNGLVVAAGAFFTGPSAAAVRVRGWFTSGLGSIRRRGEAAGVGTGPASGTYTHRAALRIGAVALAALVFIFWDHPTATVVIVIAVLLLVVLGLIELTGRPPAQPGPAPHARVGEYWGVW